MKESHRFKLIETDDEKVAEGDLDDQRTDRWISSTDGIYAVALTLGGEKITAVVGVCSNMPEGPNDLQLLLFLRLYHGQIFGILGRIGGGRLGDLPCELGDI